MYLPIWLFFLYFCLVLVAWIFLFLMMLLFLARQGLLLDSQHPEGWEKMRELESRRRVAKLEVEEHAITAPKFLKSLQGVTTLEEGQNAHFEAQVKFYLLNS